jgi:hypothetical protein
MQYIWELFQRFFYFFSWPFTILVVGKQTSEEIDSSLIEGTTKLKVQRFGSGDIT